MKRYVLVVLLFLFALSLKAESYTTIIKSPSYKIIKASNGNHEIIMKEFGRITTPGSPSLPKKNFFLSLPPGAKNITIEIKGTGLNELPGFYRISPAPIMLPKVIGDENIIKIAQKEYKNRYKRIYSSNNPFPLNPGKKGIEGNFRKWRYTTVSYCPFVYHPKSRKLLVYSGAIVTINYNFSGKGTEEWNKIQQSLSDKVMDNIAKRMFINYNEAKKWYKPMSKTSKNNSLINYDRVSPKSFGSIRANQYPYIIIIPDDSYENAIFSLMQWKTDMGDTSGYYTITFINSNYSGQDLQEKIRNCLKANYQTYGFQYVLLVGDIPDIPMRYCWPDFANHTYDPDDNPIPTDHYYADLTGNWDSDGDGYFGEIGQDSMDFIPEVIVGRIPWSDTGVVRHICEKTVRFEQNTDASYKKNGLLLGTITFYDPWFTDESDIMEQEKDSLLVPEGWTYTRLYERGGIHPSSNPSEDSITQYNTSTYWNSIHYGYVNWSSHGGIYGAYRTIWEGDYNYNDTCEINEKAQPPFFDTSDIFLLNDFFPSIVYGSACLTSYPEYWNLGQRLILNGAVAYIGATRCVLGPIGNPLYWWQGGNTGLNYLFTLEMIGYEMKVGMALFMAKYDYLLYFWDEPYYQIGTNLYGFNLYGDPALIWQGYATGIEDVKNDKNEEIILIKAIPGIFTKSTKITYAIGKKSKINVSIYDMSGRVVVNLVNNIINPGIYSVNWYGKDKAGNYLPSGMYFCFIKNEKKSLTTKLIFIK